MTCIYLMADFGKGPRVFRTYSAGGHSNLRGAPWWPPSNHGTAARSWWLVEAESADAARLTITHAGHVLGAIGDPGYPSPLCSCGVPLEPTILGRILERSAR